MKTRLTEYLNTSTFTVEYGVKVYFRGKWRHLALAGKAFIVKTVAEAQAKRAELRKESWKW